MWDSFWDFIWYTIVIFAFVAYLIVLWHIIIDLFRDKSSGWIKAVWIIFLILLPYITAIVYLLVKGRGMADRQNEAVKEAKQATDSYIQSVATVKSPAEQIADAAIRAYETGEDAARGFPAAVLPELEDLIELVDADIHDEITAKLHRALGMAILAGAKEDDADDLTARQGQALRCYQRALQLDEKVGVKKPISQLQSALKKAGALPENSPETQSASEKDGEGT